MLEFPQNVILKDITSPKAPICLFFKKQKDSTLNRVTETSPEETGLLEKYYFIYLCD